MAAHALIGLPLGWSFPSPATFLAGCLAVAAAIRGRNLPIRATAGLAAPAAVIPMVVPAPLVLAALAAAVATRGESRRDPVRNLALALPSLTVLLLVLAA